MNNQEDLRPKATSGQRLAIEMSSAILEEILNFAVELFRNSTSNPANTKTENSSIYLLYAHIIEMIDGVSTLISHSSPSAASLLVRSAFETVLALEYIAQDDSRRRSLAWFVGQVHSQLEFHERHDPDTEFGKTQQSLLLNDKYTGYYELPLPGMTIQEFRRKEQGLREVLAQPELAEIEAEYQTRKSQMKRGKSPVWYQLFGGPQYLGEMAKCVGLKATYNDFYPTYSSIGHAQNLSRFLQNMEGGMAEVIFRDPRTARGVTQNAARFILHAIKIFDKLIPPLGVDTEKWYVDMIAPKLILLEDDSLFID